MKKLFFAIAAILSFVACSVNQPVVTISASGSFNADNVAAVSLSLSEIAETDIQVLISGTPADKLEFDNPVIIPAGSRGAGFMVKVNPEGIDEGTAVNLGIQDAIGAKIGNPSNVSLTLMSYGGGNGNESGNENGGNGEESGNMTRVSTWTIEMDGDPYTDEYGDWIDLKVVTDGIKYYGVEGITDIEYAAYYESFEDYIQSWEDYIVDQLKNNSITDLLFANSDYTYIGYPGEGAGKIYLVEFDANGKATGRYNVVDVVFPAFEGSGGLDITATLVSNWSAVMNGDPYTDEYGDWIDLTVSTPGIKYYAAQGIRDEFFNNYYEGVEELIEDLTYEIEGYLEEGEELADILFVDGEYTYIEYPGEGQGQIFIIEFDDDGMPTGRYGVSSATFPEYESGSGGGGNMDDFKTEIGVPDNFTVNTAIGASYLGLYHGDSSDMSVITATGTGSAMWYLDVFEAGSVSANDIPALAAEIATDIEETLAEYIDYYGEYFPLLFSSLGDFLAQAVLGTYEGEPLGYDATQLGSYDVVVLTFTDDGDMTGEYNIVTVTVDGHDFEMPDSAPARVAGLRNHFPVGKGLGNLVPASSRHAARLYAHAAHTKAAARHHSPRHAKSAKKLNKICRLK